MHSADKKNKLFTTRIVVKAHAGLNFYRKKTEASALKQVESDHARKKSCGSEAIEMITFWQSVITSSVRFATFKNFCIYMAQHIKGVHYIVDSESPLFSVYVSRPDINYHRNFKVVFEALILDFRLPK